MRVLDDATMLALMLMGAEPLLQDGALLSYIVDDIQTLSECFSHSNPFGPVHSRAVLFQADAHLGGVVCSGDVTLELFVGERPDSAVGGAGAFDAAGALFLTELVHRHVELACRFLLIVGALPRSRGLELRDARP